MFEKGTKVHLIGIKGVGMTALAHILQSRGVIVTGSDGPAQFFTDTVLRSLGISFHESFAPEHIPADVSAVISSVAYFFPERSNGRQGPASDGAGDGNIRKNPEVDEALRRELRLYTYPEALGIISTDYKVIAVAGSHGKSTTTALLGWILEQNNIDPTVMVGTKVKGWERNSRAAHSTSSGQGQKPWLIVEADEYRDAFLRYKPHGAIITSIDYDHPDYFKTPEQYANSFKQLVNNIDLDGFLVIEGDNRETKLLAQYGQERGLNVLTYGFSSPSPSYKLVDDGIGPSPKQGSSQNKLVSQLFRVLFNGREFAASIPFPGKQYVLNSGAAIAAASLVGVTMEAAAGSVATFPGTARRFEVLRADKDCIIIDDYAYHPTAIQITLEGVKTMYPSKKIVAIFQPHMFSRTEALLKNFAESFGSADAVGIMEIYPSAREVAGPVGGRHLAQQMRLHHQDVTYLETSSAAAEYLKEHARDGTVIVLMGAGDVNALVSSL